MHWNSAVRRSWITYFSWLASQVLAFHDGPSLTSSLQPKMILICSIYEFEDIQLLHPYNINISALLDFNIRQRFSKLNFFCYKAIEILMFFFLEIDISRLICLCLCSLETCQVLFAWCTRGQEVEVDKVEKVNKVQIHRWRQRFVSGQFVSLSDLCNELLS